jgi:hypothetical protein
MALNWKYTVFYTLLSLLLFWLLVAYVSYLAKHWYIYQCREGLTNNQSNNNNQVSTDYKPKFNDAFDFGSPLYSHTVDLPLVNTVTCQNFCGPQNQCAITREQCTSDIDCQGCQDMNKGTSYKLTPKVQGWTPAMNVSNYGDVYYGSKGAEVKQPYWGYDKWTPSFNMGLDMYGKNQDSNTFMTEEERRIQSMYPSSITATGMFYNTTAPSYNADIPTNYW